VAQHLGLGQARMVIDHRVDLVVADWRLLVPHCGGSAASSPATALGDTTDFLDVHVDQLARRSRSYGPGSALMCSARETLTDVLRKRVGQRDRLDATGPLNRSGSTATGQAWSARPRPKPIAARPAGVGYWFTSPRPKTPLYQPLRHEGNETTRQSPRLRGSRQPHEAIVGRRRPGCHHRPPGPAA
jgi:hypothetical protein